MTVSGHLQNIIGRLNEASESLYAPLDSLIERLPLPEWLLDAVIDSVHLLPFLFIIFLIIEIIEFFFADKINEFIKKFEFAANLIGPLTAAVPQCGFPVIAGTMYLKKYITKGALIGIYLASSDEAIPVLLSNPQAAGYVMPVICIKIVTAVIAGCLIDLVLGSRKYIFKETSCSHHECEEEEGCCSHSVSGRRRRELIYHPVKHTFNVFIFILIITIILNYLFKFYNLEAVFSSMGAFETAFAAVIGLIPNCAVSIALALMLLKGTISFGAAMAGLLSNAGLGILVLLRHKESWKDTMLIIFILILISIITGLLINYVFLYDESSFIKITAL